jgi:hypothetical protein
MAGRLKRSLSGEGLAGRLDIDPQRYTNAAIDE